MARLPNLGWCNSRPVKQIVDQDSCSNFTTLLVSLFLPEKEVKMYLGHPLVSTQMSQPVKSGFHVIDATDKDGSPDRARGL